MSLLIIANVVLVVSAVIGMVMIAHYRKEGFIVFLLVETSMGYIGLATGNLGLTMAAGIYLVCNVYSYCKWSKWL